MIKPPVLSKGDRVAAVSLSWGGPAERPERYAAGKLGLERALGVEVVEMPHALMAADWLHDNPRARADDLMQALMDPDIHGIVSTIGGDDSVRILPWLDLDVIRDNPKVFMGFSDTTVTHLAFLAAGVTSFYGPAIMTAFAEGEGMFDYTTAAIRRALFSTSAIGRIEPNHEGWTTEYLDWSDPDDLSRRRTLLPTRGWRYLQGEGIVEGRLIGGCIEVLDWLRGTSVWPQADRWDGAVLFLETSEEAPTPDAVRRMLRSLAAVGVLDRISALLVGRPCQMLSSDEVEAFEMDAFEGWVDAYDEAIMGVVRSECGKRDLAVVTNMDFGHVDPLFVLPIGQMARLDMNLRHLSLPESAVV